MLTHYKDIAQRAYKEGWAIGAFNTSNLELTQAIIEAAEEMRSPVIVNTSEKAIDYAGLFTISALVRALAERADVPVILNLDHGRSYDIAEQCASAGYTAIMRDGSALPFADNVRETRRAVLLGHEHGIGVEGEIGPIFGKEDYTEGSKEMIYTDPKEAKRFAHDTGVDLLAVAVGTAHGKVKIEKLNFDVLKKIQKETQGMPLVLHGASGNKESEIREAIRHGVAKINIDTDLRYAFSESLRKNLDDNKSLYDPRGILGPAKDAVKEKVKEYISLFGSSGKAQ